MNKINVIHNIDCLEGLKVLENDSVDIIITSPPYEDISGAGYTANKKDVLFLKLYSEFLNQLFNEMYRVLKKGGQLFFNIKHKTHNRKLSSVHWVEFLESFKLFDFKSYIIWKYAGSFDSTNKRFHLDYEVIYHLSKGDDIYLNEDVDIKDPLSSVWYVPHNIKERLHPTQMPELLVERILKIASKEYDVVLDPFCGSGTTPYVAFKMNRKFISYELNPDYYNIAIKRLNIVN